MSVLAPRSTHPVVACARAATLLAAATSLLLAFLSARPGEKSVVRETSMTLAAVAAEVTGPARRDPWYSRAGERHIP